MTPRSATASTHSKPSGKRNGIREHWAQRGFSPVELLNLWEPTGAWEAVPRSRLWRGATQET